MLKKLVFYTRLCHKFIRKDAVNNEDYRKEYNKVSTTYNNWLNEMGQFTDKIINLDHIQKENKLKILDFACGTGYISKGLLEKGINCKITAVDYSDKMLEQFRYLEDDRLKIVHYDGIKFLENTDEKYDVIFIGWALPYFNYKELFKLFKKVLNPGGVVKIIANIQGTLSEIEDVFIKVMYKNQKKIIKPMYIRFNLPNGKSGLIKWFNKYGFKEVEVQEYERLVVFEEAEELLKWLNETGSVAGTACIFENYDSVKDNLIEEIKKTKYKNGKYEINHKFAYGTFKLI